MRYEGNKLRLEPLDWALIVIVGTCLFGLLAMA